MRLVFVLRVCASTFIVSYRFSSSTNVQSYHQCRYFLHIHLSAVETITLALVPQLRTASSMIYKPIADLRHAYTRCLEKH